MDFVDCVFSQAVGFDIETTPEASQSTTWHLTYLTSPINMHTTCAQHARHAEAHLLSTFSTLQHLLNAFRVVNSSRQTAKELPFCTGHAPILELKNGYDALFPNTWEPMSSRCRAMAQSSWLSSWRLKAEEPSKEQSKTQVRKKMCKANEEKTQSKRFKINSKVFNILLAIGKAGKFEGMQAPNTKKRTYENLSQETHDWQKTEVLWNRISIGPAEASGWSCQLINLLGESAKVREKNKGCMPNACRTRRKLQRIMPPCFCKSLESINSPWLHHSPHHYRLTPLPDLSLKNIPTSMDKAWQATADWVHWNGAFERGSGRIFLASTFHWDRNCNLMSWDITWHLVPLLAKEPGPTPWAKVTSGYTRLQIGSQTLLRLCEPSRTSNKGSLQFEPSMEMIQMIYWIQLSFKSSVPTVKLNLNAALPWLVLVSHVLPAAITLSQMKPIKT